MKLHLYKLGNKTLIYKDFSICSMCQAIILTFCVKCGDGNTTFYGQILGHNQLFQRGYMQKSYVVYHSHIRRYFLLFNLKHEKRLNLNVFCLNFIQNQILLITQHNISLLLLLTTRLLLLFYPFLFPPKKRGNKKRRMIQQKS